jgi:predicted 3-demethylubiquinone-9 3-methyltransferase (glyoxalase superfamily)
VHDLDRPLLVDVLAEGHNPVRVLHRARERARSQFVARFHGGMAASMRLLLDGQWLISQGPMAGRRVDSGAVTTDPEGYEGSWTTAMPTQPYPGGTMAVLKFATHLWFDNQAEEAARFYTNLFEDSRVEKVTLAPAGIPGAMEGSPFIIELTLMGQNYIFLNGGPEFPFNAQVSLYVLCDSQVEVDHYWDALLANGGAPQQCGWLADRFGLSWQVIPVQLEQLMDDPDPQVTRRVTEAMLKMVKIDVAALEAAARG